MLAEIDVKIRKAEKAPKQLNYVAKNISAKQFYDYMTGEIFSEDKTTLRDVLDSDFLMVRELVEMSELRKMGRKINKRTVMESPKTMIYEAHFTAMEYESDYALLKRDFSWMEKRLRDHHLVLADDLYLPEKLKPRGCAILGRFRKLIRK